LSYDLPKKIVSKIGASNSEFSITGQNLGYITKSKLFSPEQGGSVGGGYALPKTIIFGISLTY
jgi:hypothetical protein